MPHSEIGKKFAIIVSRSCHSYAYECSELISPDLETDPVTNGISIKCKLITQELHAMALETTQLQKSNVFKNGNIRAKFK